MSVINRKIPICQHRLNLGIIFLYNSIFKRLKQLLSKHYSSTQFKEKIKNCVSIYEIIESNNFLFLDK